MRVFWEIGKRSFQRHLAYRGAALAGLATNFFFGLLRAALLTAFYGARPEVAGLTLQDAVTFTGISQAVIAPLSMFGWYELMRSVHSGEVAADLIRPVSTYGYWLARDAGRAAAGFLWRSVTILAAYALLFDLTWPRGALGWAAVGLAWVLAWLVSFSWRFISNLAAFWSPQALGIVRLFFLLNWFLSGFLMPLRYLPEPFVRFCYLTPFPYTVDAVVEAWLGRGDPAALAGILVAQAAWAAALWLIAQLVLRAGVRRLVIQGG